jgi:DNA-directed RNA polymerase subunit alpha
MKRDGGCDHPGQIWDHLSILSIEEEEEEEAPVSGGEDRQEPSPQRQRAGIAVTLQRLSEYQAIGERVKTGKEMLKTKNFDETLNEIKEILAEMGLSFGMKVDLPPRAEVGVSAGVNE